MFFSLLLTLGVGASCAALSFWFATRRVRTQFQNAHSQAAQQAAEALAATERATKESEVKAQEVLLKAQDQALKIVEDAKKTERELRQELSLTQQRLEKREENQDRRHQELSEREAQLNQEAHAIQESKARIEERILRLEKEEERTAQLTKEEARELILRRVEDASQDAIASRIHKLERDEAETLSQKARQILVLAMERFASAQSVETTTCTVELPSDEMKGRIIGKEGRNIKAIELLTGVEIIVDDSPGVISVSGFSAVRRQVAKLAIEALIKDGRIQPARIEEAVQEAKQHLTEEMKKAGEEALYTLGIPVPSIDPKLISILGRLKYRTSYGQNVLQHSIEVAQLAAMIAEELGADVFVCKKGGLFHDIGKAVDHDMQGAHPEIGYNIMKKFGFPEEMAYQSVAHHEDKPRTIEGVIVKAADAISGSRPGARKASLEQYIQRMEELEHTAASFDGVEKAYAIQAGREVRVFVKPERIDDLTAYHLAGDIARKIESELRYPGEVRVTVIRETRVVEYAR